MKGARLKRPYQIPHSHFFSEAPHREEINPHKDRDFAVCAYSSGVVSEALLATFLEVSNKGSHLP